MSQRCHALGGMPNPSGLVLEKLHKVWSVNLALLGWNLSLVSRLFFCLSEDLTESLRRFGNWIIFLRQSQQILRGERGQWVFSYLALLSNPSVPLLLSLFLFFRDQSRTIALFQGDIIIKTTSSAHCELALHSLLQSIFLVLIVLLLFFPHHEVALKVHCLANNVSHPEDGAKQPEDKVNVHLTLFL